MNFMPAYFLSIGSNIEAHRNVPRILLALLALSPRLDVSRIVETRPTNMTTTRHFLNLALRLTTDLDAASLKEQLNQIESSLGRDRSHPDSKRKDRPADLDILFALPDGAQTVNPQWIPAEPYIRPMLVELIAAVGLACAIPPMPLPPGVEMEVLGQRLGAKPTTLLKEWTR